MQKKWVHTMVYCLLCNRETVVKHREKFNIYQVIKRLGIECRYCGGKQFTLI